MEWNEEYTLRARQKIACQKTRDGFTKRNRDGYGPFKRQLLIAGTGAGKTIMAAAMAAWNHNGRNKRTLMLANSDELCEQAIDKIWKATGERASIEKASKRASLDAPVVVGSFQTLANKERIQRFPVDHFGLVIADEAHLSIAKTYLPVLQYFDQGADTKTLGITATPERADRQSLMDWFENVGDEISLSELIESGSLVPITVQTLPIEIDASEVTNFESDENEELEAAITPYYDAIIEQWKEHASDRPTIAFHPTCYSSRTFTKRLVDAGVRAEHIDGNSKNRRDILRRFHDGRIDFLNNAQLLVAGYDEPRISCVINLRPTRHRTPYTQMIGRGTRLAEGKEDLLLLDFLWQFAEMGILRPVDLFTESDEVAEFAQKRAESGEKQNLQTINIEAQREREQQLIDRMEAHAGHLGTLKDAREFAATLHQPDLIDFRASAQWHWNEITAKQAAALEKFGVDYRTVENAGHASHIIQRVIDMRARQDPNLPDHIERASEKQIKLIKRCRAHRNPESLTFHQAHEILDRFFKNK